MRTKDISAARIQSEHYDRRGCYSSKFDIFESYAQAEFKLCVAGNYYLDRDAKTFRHILSYLRMKRENNSLLLSLPSKPEQLAR